MSTAPVEPVLAGFDPSRRRRALCVRGGWDGHQPVETSELFGGFLSEQNFEVRYADSLDAYLDAEDLAATDLVVQTWTMGTITKEQTDGLVAAVAAGTGMAGWHGGIVDSFRGTLDYQRLTGGQFLEHPGGHIDFSVEVTDLGREHPITAGIERFDVHSEQYWPFSDSLNEVLATTDTAGDETTPWPRPVRQPVIWTRQWGQGRVFVNTVGHSMPDFDVPEVALTIRRGLLWAAR